MKKLKLVLLFSVIVTGIGGAFATQEDFCENYPQYYKVGSNYYLAGDYGYNYICWSSPGSTCTYYKPNPSSEVYYQCRPGQYEQIIPLK